MGSTGKHLNLENNFRMEISFGNQVLYVRIYSPFQKMLQNVCSYCKEEQLLGPVSLWEGWRIHVKVLWRVLTKLLPEIVQLNRIIIWPLLSVHTQRTPKLNSKSEQGQTHCLPGRRERRSHCTVMCYFMTFTTLPQQLSSGGRRCKQGKRLW